MNTKEVNRGGFHGNNRGSYNYPRFNNNSNQGARNYYGGNQGRQGGYQNRFNWGSNYVRNNNTNPRFDGEGNSAVLDQNMLQKTVEAVVAALTAAQKVSSEKSASVPQQTVVTQEVAPSGGTTGNETQLASTGQV